MDIQCPYCEHSRKVSASNIPPNAEMATCPKCRRRFRFRELERKDPFEQQESPPPQREPAPAPVNSADIWESLEKMNQRWEGQPASSTPAPQPDEPSQPKETPQPKEQSQPGNESLSLFRLPFSKKRAKKRPAQPAPEGAKAGASPEASPAPAKAFPPSGQPERAHALPDLPPIPVGQEDPLPDIHPGKTQTPPYANLPLLQIMTDVAPDRASDAEAKDPSGVAELPLLSLEPESAPTPVQEEAIADGVPAEGVLPEAASPDGALAQGAAAADWPPSFSPLSDMGESEAAASALPDSEQEDPPPNMMTTAAFPTYEERPPEERVEHDMRYLRIDNDTRPSINLGMLREFDEGDDEEEAVETRPAPWESPEKFGWFGAFFRTIKEVMFNAPDFFRAMPKGGSPAFSFLYFLIHGYLAIIFTLVWRHATALVLGLPEFMVDTLALPVLLLLAPVALGFLLLMAAGSMRLMLDLSGYSKTTFSFACKIVAYAVSPLILSVIPFIGPLAGTLWFLFSLALGCRFACGTGWFKAFAAALPTALMIVAGGGFFFI